MRAVDHWLVVAGSYEIEQAAAMAPPYAGSATSAFARSEARML